MEGLIKAANKDVRNWTADNHKLFVYEEYDPAEDNSAYGLSVCGDYRLPAAKATELEGYTSYYSFTTEDKNIVKYMEEHPELLSDQNVIADDDPILGATGEDW